MTFSTSRLLWRNYHCPYCFIKNSLKSCMCFCWTFHILNSTDFACHCKSLIIWNKCRSFIRVFTFYCLFIITKINFSSYKYCWCVWTMMSNFWIPLKSFKIMKYITCNLVSEWLLFNANSAIFQLEQVNFQWDDDEVQIVLDQHAGLDFHSASSLKQQSTGRHVAPLGHIILIPSLCSFSLMLHA